MQGIKPSSLGCYAMVSTTRPPVLLLQRLLFYAFKYITSTQLLWTSLDTVSHEAIVSKLTLTLIPNLCR